MHLSKSHDKLDLVLTRVSNKLSGALMGRIIIDEQRCKACLICIDVCPKKMIEQGKKVNKSGYYPVVFLKEKNECTGCALCAQSCPDIAIKEVYK